MKKAFTLIELLIVVAIIAILAAIAVPNFMEAQVRSKVARAMTDMRTEALALEAYTVDYNVAPLHSPSSAQSGPADASGNYCSLFDGVPQTATAGQYWPGKATNVVNGDGLYWLKYSYNYPSGKNSFLNPGDCRAAIGKASTSPDGNRWFCWWEQAITTPVGYLSRRLEDTFKNRWINPTGGAETSNSSMETYSNFFYTNYEHITNMYMRFNGVLPVNPTSNVNYDGSHCVILFTKGGYRWVLASAGPSGHGNHLQLEAKNYTKLPYVGTKMFPSYDPTNGTKSWGYIIRTNKGVYTIDNQDANMGFNTGSLTVGIP